MDIGPDQLDVEVVDEEGLQLICVNGKVLREATQFEIMMWEALQNVNHFGDDGHLLDGMTGDDLRRRLDEIEERWGSDDEDDDARLNTERRCFVCGGLQRDEGSEWSCKKGHSGAKGVDRKGQVWQGTLTFDPMPSDLEQLENLVKAYPDWFEIEPDDIPDGPFDDFPSF